MKKPTGWCWLCLHGDRLLFLCVVQVFLSYLQVEDLLQTVQNLKRPLITEPVVTHTHTQPPQGAHHPRGEREPV